MKRILITNRGDLIDSSKLKKIQEIACEDFQDYVYTRIKDYELVIFYCELLQQSIVLKNRYDAVPSDAFDSDNKTTLFNIMFSKSGGCWDE